MLGALQQRRDPGKLDSDVRLIDIAPTPILAWFERFDNRVVARVEVFGRVLVL